MYTRFENTSWEVRRHTLGSNSVWRWPQFGCTCNMCSCNCIHIFPYQINIFPQVLRHEIPHENWDSCSDINWGEYLDETLNFLYKISLMFMLKKYSKFHERSLLDFFYTFSYNCVQKIVGLKISQDHKSLVVYHQTLSYDQQVCQELLLCWHARSKDRVYFHFA